MNTSTPYLRSFGSEGALAGPGPRPLHFIRVVATASAGAVQALRELADAWRRHRRAQALRHTLKALDDRTLADIGLHRGDIAAIGWGMDDRGAHSLLHARGP
jgi:uncharacterized protein YjiS (DUF1127 family)